MIEKELLRLLKGQSLNKNAIYLKSDAVTPSAKLAVDEMLEHLIAGGIVGFHGSLYYLLADQGIVLAKVTLKKRNFVVLTAVDAGYEIKISGDEADGLLLGDLIYVKKAQGNYHGIDYLKATDSFVGRFSMTSSGKNQLLVDYLNSCGKIVFISSVKEGLDLHQGDLIRCRIESYNGHSYTVSAQELLVRASDVGSDISMIIRENDAPYEFPSTVTEEAKSLPQTVSRDEMENRMDLRSENIVTIDGDDAHDFDDAVSIKRDLNGYQVLVSIADVTHYVRPNSALDEEAVERGTSIYVADRVVPMLPFELSNGICSLNPDVDRLALTVIMYLDASGNVYSSKVVRSVIHSHGRLTYRLVNDHFRGEKVELPKETLEMLDLLHECSLKIRKRRTRQGALKLSSNELKFKLDEEGVPTDVIKVEQGESEKMIEDYMIIANCEVAKLLKSHHIPVLYRVHEFPKTEKLSDFKDFIKKMDPKLIGTFPRTKDLSGARLNDFLSSIENPDLREVLSYMMLRALQKARYTPEELGHFGLSEPYYCHFTSPIRRYPDDIIHRLVKDYLIDGKTFDYDDVYSDLLSLGDRTSASEVKADRIERQVNDLEACKYMSSRIGNTYKASVTGIINKGMFVETEIGIEGFLSFHCMHGDAFSFNERTYCVEGKYHPEYSFTIGTKLDVTILSVDVDRGEIDVATPEFYKENALDLSQEDRIGLARYGIFVEEDEEPDFEEVKDKTFSHSKEKDGKYRSRSYESESQEFSKEEPLSRRPKTRSGYHSGKTSEKKTEALSFRKKDTRGFDSQIRKVDDGKFKKKRAEYKDHQGYDGRTEEKPKRFDRREKDSFKKDYHGKRDFDKSKSSFHKDSRSFKKGDKPFHKDFRKGKPDDKRSYDKKPFSSRSSYRGKKEGFSGKKSYRPRKDK